MSAAASAAEPALAFVAEPAADLLLRSSDGFDFPVRRISLQANCDVFDGMFAAGSDDAAERDDKTGLTLVKLEESGAELDLFLRFIIRDQVRFPDGGTPLSLKDTQT